MRRRRTEMSDALRNAAQAALEAESVVDRGED